MNIRGYRDGRGSQRGPRLRRPAKIAAASGTAGRGVYPPVGYVGSRWRNVNALQVRCEALFTISPVDFRIRSDFS
jgi:hypothetical protein